MSSFQILQEYEAMKAAKEKEKRRKRLKWKLLLGALVLCLLAGYFAYQSYRHDQKVRAALLSLEEAAFLEAADGDTLKVTLGGETVTVRLIGVDCPESVHPDDSQNSPEGAAASAFTASLLKEGQRLWLQKDVSETDRYGRLLRYVWLELPSDPTDETQQRSFLLNARLLEHGHAEAKAYPPDTSLHELFLEIQQESRTPALYQ